MNIKLLNDVQDFVFENNQQRYNKENEEHEYDRINSIVHLNNPMKKKIK